MAVGALAAELGHELQGPLNLLRMTHDRAARGEPLDADDVSMLGEELERLSRLSARLRELARSSLQKRACTLKEIVELAVSGDPRDPRAAELELDVDAAPSWHCDPSLMAAAVRELIDNALEARRARAGVRVRSSGPPALCVWDDGGGLELDAARAMAWGVTTRPAAAGIGLTIALRAARAHGFGLEVRRHEPLTEVWLTAPEPAPARAARPGGA